MQSEKRGVKIDPTLVLQGLIALLRSLLDSRRCHRDCTPYFLTLKFQVLYKTLIINYEDSTTHNSHNCIVFVIFQCIYCTHIFYTFLNENFE